MREIKFRVWDAKEKQMLEVNHLFNLDNKQPIEVWTNYYEGGYRFNPDKSELMQYTGLDDVHGVEIYEGDVMRAVPVRRQYPTAFSLKEHVGTLVIGSQRLTISGKTYDKELYDYEVIGNKFQNPELLEER